MIKCLLCVVLALACEVRSQQAAPCSTKDNGPFLATSPALNMQVYEATEQELSSPASIDRYRSELRLYGEVNAQGPNGIVLEVMPDYQFMNPEDTFRFNHSNGINYIELFKALDRDGPTSEVTDDTNIFSFTLKCSLQSNMSDFTYYDATIFVMDVNDNAPEFVNLTSSLMLNELTPKELTVLAVRAMDKDLNSTLTYSLMNRTFAANDMASYFSIDPLTGDLSVVRQLDYETMMEGTLVILVKDGGFPERTTTATVQVSVTDGDDQGPAFIYPGCWMHRGRCSWPKYTTSTVLKMGQSITVFPVPNKVQAAVDIRAKDMDFAANPVTFSIASTIPPGNENMFMVTTMSTGMGDYRATITTNRDMTVNHGFEIFLQAEEVSENRMFDVAMILFEDPNHICTTGSNSPQNGGESNTSPKSAEQEAQNERYTGTQKEETAEKYTEPIIALIVVTAILAAFVLCLALAIVCIMRGSRARSPDTVALSHSNTNGQAAL